MVKVKYGKYWQMSQTIYSIRDKNRRFLPKYWGGERSPSADCDENTLSQEIRIYKKFEQGA